MSASLIGARDTALERRLSGTLAGEVRFDAGTRARYAVDASIYQIVPAGVAFPRHAEDARAALTVAAEHGVPVIARGAGTSQNGQPLGTGLVLDFSRHMDAVTDYDPVAGLVTVEPGLVLERLNARLAPDGWFFPVEPSTANRCTLGGMAGNNACGARSIRYGKMVDNVEAITAIGADGAPLRFSPAEGAGMGVGAAMVALAGREAQEIAARFPKVQRRVGGYNLDALLAPAPNLAQLLVGSEGTLALTTALTLKLARLPAHRVMGVCQFPSFRAAMVATPRLVGLGPVAVELVDHNVLALGDEIPLFRDTLAGITRGRPAALLIVELAGEDRAALGRDLVRLDQAMADLGFPDAVVPVPEARQRAVWAMREACLAILMSMKGDAKPVSFIEDCAVPLEHLADYTAAIDEVFARHGTRGTWYAHASVGCLHVRPILNLKEAGGVAAMRAIAEEAGALVRRYKGSYSGEHGDGISRSEFIAPMFGERLAAAFAEVKRAFDPKNRLNPGKIVAAPRFDDRRLMRWPEGYETRAPSPPALDWSAFGGFAGAVEMCNANGACRSRATGVMCPSFRATREEEHVTRGRANVLRLALAGQLGPKGLSGPEVAAALDLCVSCKACRRECPTGVDMARLKIEVMAARRAAGESLTRHEWLVAHLPRYAPLAAAWRGVPNLRDRVPGLASLSERLAGFSASRPLPAWRRPWREPGEVADPRDVVGDGLDIVLFADTFDRYFEPDNLEAARQVLLAAGYRLHRVVPVDGARPLCCGRTYLAVGLVAQARREAGRVLSALSPFVARGARVVGLEPSCLLTFRDEFLALFPESEPTPSVPSPLVGEGQGGGGAARGTSSEPRGSARPHPHPSPRGGGESRLAARLAGATFLLEELLAADHRAGRLALSLVDRGPRVAHLHGHCHQKSFDAMAAVAEVLGLVPGLVVKPIESSCCGMAGAFGYAPGHQAVSRAMAELSLFPALRKAGPDDLVVADGFSCRHQIAHGLGLEARHVAMVLAEALG